MGEGRVEAAGSRDASVAARLRPRVTLPPTGKGVPATGTISGRQSFSPGKIPEIVCRLEYNLACLRALTQPMNERINLQPALC